MSNKLIEEILKQNSNSQHAVSQYITQQEPTSKLDKQELIKQGYSIFERFGLLDCLVSLYFIDRAFLANIKFDNRPTIVEEEKIRKIFEDEIGYSIDFSL